MVSEWGLTSDGPCRCTRSRDRIGEEATVTASGREQDGAPVSAPSTEGFPAALARRLPSETLAWAVLQPNAIGRGELRSRAGFIQRQELKSRNLCPAERVFVAVGVDEVVMWHALPLRVLGRELARWPRDRLEVEAVEVVGAPESWWPAVRVSVRVPTPSGRVRIAPIAELRPVREEPRAWAVVELLLRS
jgi:hypothetical protein